MVYGRISSPEDQGRWIKAFARQRALELNPRAFGHDESIEIMETVMLMECALLDKYAGEDRNDNLFVTLDGMIVDRADT